MLCVTLLAISQGTVAAGAAAGGVLAAAAGPRATLFLFGAISLAVTVFLLPAPVRRAQLRLPLA